MARAQQMLMEAWADNLAKGSALPGFGLKAAPANADPMQWMSAGAEAWSKGLESWSQMLGQATKAGEARDRRFGSPEWSENPLFDTMRQSYLAISDKLLGTVEEIEGIDEAARSRLRFATKGFVDAMSPANYLALNPQGRLPALEVDGAVITQAPAILEWLEETHPERPLLPADPLARAKVRALDAIVACDITPLQNLGTGRELALRFGAGDDAVNAWCAHFIGAGLAAFQVMAERAGGDDSPERRRATLRSTVSWCRSSRLGSFIVPSFPWLDDHVPDDVP